MTDDAQRTPSDPAPAPDPTPTPTIGDWLSAQKEVITLILFFLGGLYFVHATFATRSELASIRCMMGAQMKMEALSVQHERHERMREIMIGEMLVMVGARDSLSEHERAIAGLIEQHEKEESTRAGEVAAEIKALGEGIAAC